MKKEPSSKFNVDENKSEEDEVQVPIVERLSLKSLASIHRTDIHAYRPSIHHPLCWNVDMSMSQHWCHSYI